MNKHSILIIDDETRLLESMARILEEEFHIHTAPSGREGLMILGSQHISMVLLDLNMPQMNGVEVLEEIRRKDYKVKVVIMTGGKDYEWTRRCADLAIQGFLEKPIDPLELVERINKVVSAGKNENLQSSRADDFNEKTALLSPLLKETLLYIEGTLHKGISREDVSTHLNVSPDYLSRLFMDEYGMHLSDFINRRRIEKSRKYLEKVPFMKIKEVAEAVGISDQNYFCRLFKRHTGITPTDFQKK